MDDNLSAFCLVQQKDWLIDFNSKLMKLNNPNNNSDAWVNPQTVTKNWMLRMIKRERDLKKFVTDKQVRQRYPASECCNFSLTELLSFRVCKMMMMGPLGLSFFLFVKRKLLFRLPFFSPSHSEKIKYLRRRQFNHI